MSRFLRPVASKLSSIIQYVSRFVTISQYGKSNCNCKKIPKIAKPSGLFYSKPVSKKKGVIKMTPVAVQLRTCRWHRWSQHEPSKFEKKN